MGRQGVIYNSICPSITHPLLHMQGAHAAAPALSRTGSIARWYSPIDSLGEKETPETWRELVGFILPCLEQGS